MESFQKKKKKEIVKLIYAATGLDTKQVQVNAVKFNNSRIDSTDYVTSKTEKENNKLTLILTIALIILAGLFGTIYFRRKNEKYDINEVLEQKSTKFEQIEEIDFDKGKSEIKSQIEKFIDKKPEAVAQLLRTWLNED